MSYGMTATLPDYIGFSRHSSPEFCDEYDGYQAGDECPRCDGFAICGACERHVSTGPIGAGHAIQAVGFRDVGPDGSVTRGSQWWCPECVAAFELSREIQRCHACSVGYHPDLDAVHDGICADCDAKAGTV